MADPLIFALKTPLGNLLKFVSMEGSEEISRPFEYSVLAVAEPDASVVFETLLGKPAQVTVSLSGKPQRHYHGIVTAAGHEGAMGFSVAYRLTLRPWLWLLTRVAQVRIFQKKSVPDILSQVFAAYGGAVELSLHGTYRPREYCVQYRESDFNFVSRLMEEEGIFYFFQHVDGKHTLVVADAPGAHVAMLGVQSLPFRPQGSPLPSVQAWRWSAQIQTSKVVLRDHSFQLPSNHLENSATIARQHAQNSLEAYDYPAGLAPYPDEPAALSKLSGETLAMAKVRVEEQQSRYALAEGATNSTQLCCGARFSFAEHPTQDGEYVVLATHIQMRMPAYEAGASGDASHDCRFTAFASKVPFRPARSTPKPHVAGPQTATVVGPAGEEIFVDKYGRIKVQFHWDRAGKKDANSSCFVRVAQPSAGKNWGIVFLPRIGHEVVVDFLEGDPDQPIVTGSVYNAENMPPQALPANKTISAVRSRSTPHGGAGDRNELRFEDLKDKEYLLLHAQKDKVVLVKHDDLSQVDNDLHAIVKKDRKEKVEGEFHLTVLKDVKQKFDGKLSLKVAKDILLATDGVHALKAAKDITAESGAAYSIKSATDLHVKAGKNVGVDGGMNVHVKGGMNVVIEAGMQLTLKASGGSVVIGPDGVSITGALVKINSGGGPGSGAGASPVAPSAPDAPSDPQAPTVS